MQIGVVIRFVFEVLRIQIDHIAKEFFAFENGFIETHNTIQALMVETLKYCGNFWHCFSRPAGAWNVWPIRMV